jgi:hypothetical protein
MRPTLTPLAVPRLAAPLWSSARRPPGRCSLGRVRLAEGDAADAERLCSEAARLWNEVGAPYEAAVARMGLAEALRAGARQDQADLELAAARAVLDRIEAAQTAQPAAGVEGRDGLDELAAADLNVFRREGDYWSLVFEGRTVRVRDLKGMRYLARLLADPGREFHVLDLVAAETGRDGQIESAGDSACRTRHSVMRARCSTREPRTRTAAAWPRSKTTSSRRAPSGTPSEPRRQTPNATSSFENSRARLASVVAIDEPHPRPSVPGSELPARSARG